MTLYTLYQGPNPLVFNQQPFSVLDLVGGGMFPIRLLKERGAQQHGSTAVGYLLDERVLNLSVLINANNRGELVAYRDQLANFLKPLSGVPLKLHCLRDDNSQRQIDVFTIGIVDFPNTTENRFGSVQRLVVQLEAPDPVPYDPNLNNIDFALPAPGGYFVPLKIPAKYTLTDFIDSMATLTYMGDWPAYPKVYFTGPATDPVVTNMATGDKLDFLGRTIPAGDTWIVDLAYGVKRIVDQTGVARDYALTDDSDLMTWAIVPDPTAPGGVNDIRVAVLGATSATKIRVEFYDRYPNLD